MGLGLDYRLSHLLGETATHALAVLRQRKPHDLADPELDLAAHEDLVTARKGLRDRANLVGRDHRDQIIADA